MEFIGLYVILDYCFNTSNQEIKKARCKEKVIEKDLKMEEYKRALFNKEIIYKKLNNIQSQKHQLFTNEINKIALSYDDDKRYPVKKL